MTSEQLAHKYGYTNGMEAAGAIEFARAWERKNRGKRMPVHIRRAFKLLAEFQAIRDNERGQLAKKLGQLARNPRTFFGAIPADARFRSARLWLRRTLGLHLNKERMVAHFRALVPPQTFRVYRDSSLEIRNQASEQMAGVAFYMYGLGDPGNRHRVTGFGNVSGNEVARWVVQRALENK